MVKVGIIGSGFGLYGILPAFHSTSGCKVISICGKHTSRLINYCKSIGLTKTYTGWQDMLDKENLDALAIAVTPDAQYNIARTAIEKNLHIFAEKPLAVNLKKARELLALAEKKGIVHAVDFIFPEIPEWKKVKEIIDNKTLGRLKQINLNWDFLSHVIKNKISSWKTDVDQGGGALAYYFSHSLYYLEFFAGKIISLQSLLSYSKESINGGETGVNLLLQFENDVSGYAHLSCINPGLNRHQLIFTFEKGVVILENEDSVTTNFRVKIYQNKKNKQLTIPKENSLKKDEDERVRIVRHITARFIKSITGKKECSPSFKAGVRVQELIEKIRQQVKPS